VLLDGTGRTAFDVFAPLGYGVWPPHEWPRGNTVRETFRLVVPASLRPGTYDLYLRVFDDARPSIRPSMPSDEEIVRRRYLVPLGPVTVR